MNIETRAYFTILKAVAPHLKWKEADWSSAEEIVFGVDQPYPFVTFCPNGICRVYLKVPDCRRSVPKEKWRIRFNLNEETSIKKMKTLLRRIK